MRAAMLLSLAMICLAMPGLSSACTDNDARIAEMAASIGRPEITGCVDVGGFCQSTTPQGDAIREHCCDTCLVGAGGVENSLPPPDDADPVQLYLLSGQSECKGQAKAELLTDSGKYPELEGAQPGVWFARLLNDDLAITPMEVGEVTKAFGPEVSFGQRVREVTGARVMVVKYCWGGSNVRVEWNPATDDNSWDYSADDGTAEWLLANGVVDLTDKKKLFVNLVYTARLATEALAAAGVAYEWKSFVWVQGSADKLDSWQNIGENTARLFDAVRERAVDTWDLPIVDTGAGAHHNLSSGKVHAAQTVKGCNVANVEIGNAMANPDSDCIVGPTDPCTESTFVDHSFSNYYGWDPNIPDELKPPGFSSKEFHWYRSFPTNMHSEYDGMVLMGRMYANAYVRYFTTTPLPAAMAAEDPAIKFPWLPCSPAGSKPTADNICWMDLRGSLATSTCIPQPPPDTPAPIADTPAPTAQSACTDDDATIAEMAASTGRPEITGCVDVGGFCQSTTPQGDVIREHCCVTCLEGGGGVENSLPPPDDADPVQLYLLSGQSECVGHAQSELLTDSGKYPELEGAQPGVWFARLLNDDLAITPMEVGEVTQTFGPEVSFGQRVREVTGARVMVVKYCWGGSNVRVEWNPATDDNSWDYSADDGTAEWLLANGVDLTDKKKLFVNLVYTARLATEALVAAGVAYEWKSFVWVQGSADKLDGWQNIGENTARLFDAVRERAVDTWDLPIVDTGANVQHNLTSGKVHAAQTVKGCNVANVEMANAAENPESDCQITPSNPCTDNTFFNEDFSNYYGWDPLVPDELKPPGFSSKEFRWYRRFPNNLHSEYDGMVLMGRMLANGYVRYFTTTPLPAAMAAEDPAIKFPWLPCSPAGSKPTADNICWMDLRGSLATSTCIPQPPPDTPAPTADTPAPTADTPAPTADTPAPIADTPAPTADTPAPIADTPAPTTQPTSGSSRVAVPALAIAWVVAAALLGGSAW